MITYKRKKKRGQREQNLKNLPIETIEYRLSEEDQVCSCCGDNLREMSTETRQEIEVFDAYVLTWGSFLMSSFF